ncbi:winged helix-turn-helix transcriptional regulator [Arthrobacter sp. Sa2CUA1]|uniref:Winged helix-turn-helix transcriptional regulator n=1 Tax=Arthrobacter gallicola TaxID=2762225 RepID=A0ABR8UN03_9MICC|nr:metalloregulator ArsR/SmtB family transcription factor [Arthrobacter gallicola]MBD7993925.1 winged helix-turn-helix transcriptional regulator [Arthrobacter gallicola]
MSIDQVIQFFDVPVPPLTQEPLSGDLASGTAKKFKALGDPARLRLFNLIACHPRGESCVCDLAAAVELSQPTVSHHLKVLREAGLLECERRGNWVFYRVIPSALALLSALLLSE